MRFFPLLLPLALISAACSGSGSWTYHTDGYTVFTSSADGQTTSIQIGQGENERKVRVIGSVDLGETGSDMLLLSPGASFGLKESGWDGKRQLDVRRTASGASEYIYQVEGTEVEFEAQAKEWLAGVVHELHRKSSVGAKARAERLLRDRGPESVLEAVKEVESTSAIGIYISTLLNADLSTEQLIAVVDVASGKVSSSSGLEGILVDVAGERPTDDALTLRVVQASGRISSSSSHGAVLQAVARTRPMSAATASAFYGSAAAISSSSTKEEVLETAIAHAPRDDASMEAYFSAADSISSSSSHGAVLSAALNHADLSSVARLRWVRSANLISSTSTREELLTRLFQTTPHDAAVLTEALAAVRQLSSSSSQDACLRAFFSREGLDKPLLREAEKTIDTISSSSTRAELQDILIERVFALQ